MKCPFCESTSKQIGKQSKTDVINSRPGKDGEEVWRRRQCLVCKEVFTTTEHFSYDSLFVVKRNLTRKRFVYEKLFASILNAVSAGKGRDQGDDAVLAKTLTWGSIQKILAFKTKYISTKDIIRTVHIVLEKEDPFFALRYAMYSAYRMKVLKGKNGV
jgi:transcriptional regulator NrdR family protein